MATAEYQRGRRARIVDLCFPTEADLKAKREMAENAGYGTNFNAWLLQQINNATSGSLYPPEYVESLKREADRLRTWLETAQEQVADYRAQVRLLQQQRDDLLLLVTERDPGAATAFLERSQAQGVRA